MSHAVVADFPVPVAPSSTMSRSPAWIRRSNSSMAAGWSPAGAWGLTTSKWPPARTISSTGRYSECATTGCSVANAMLSRVELSTDRRSAVLAGPHPRTRVALDQVPVVGLRHREHRRVNARSADWMYTGGRRSLVLGIALTDDLLVGRGVEGDLVDVGAWPAQHRGRCGSDRGGGGVRRLRGIGHRHSRRNSAGPGCHDRDSQRGPLRAALVALHGLGLHAAHGAIRFRRQRPHHGLRLSGHRPAAGGAALRLHLAWLGLPVAVDEMQNAGIAGAAGLGHLMTRVVQFGARGGAPGRGARGGKGPPAGDSAIGTDDAVGRLLRAVVVQPVTAVQRRRRQGRP